MRRNTNTIGKWQRGIVALALCLGCSVAAADTELETGVEAGAVAPSRPGVLTGLGEMALSKAYPDEAVWLTVDSDDRVLGLLFGERILPAKGALMILPEAGETAASGVAGSLAQHLADKGWAVLTVGLEAPSSSLQAVLERKSEASEEASETDTVEATSLEVDIRVEDPAEKPEAVYRERIKKTLQAGLTALANRGYERPALLAIGRTSNYITDLPSAGENLRAMIWIAPVFYTRDKAALADRLTESGVSAVLELYDSKKTDKASAKQRAVILRQAGINGYERQPVALLQPPSIDDAPGLANRIDAWLLSQ